MQKATFFTRLVSVLVMVLCIGYGGVTVATVMAASKSASAVSVAEKEPTPTCFVETTGDNVTDYSSVDASALQTAVDHAHYNDFIKVAGSCVGVQTIQNLTQTLFVQQTLTIAGGYTMTHWLAGPNPEVNHTTLSADGQGRVLYARGGGMEVTLSDLTLTDGSAVNGEHGNSDGGGIYNDRADLTLIRIKIIHNTADNGHGLGSGGGIFNNTGFLSVTMSTIADNYAMIGGGLHLATQSVLYLYHSTVSGNTAVIQGGGIDAVNLYGDINHSTISSNVSQGVGGGMSVFKDLMFPSITFDYSTLANNTAASGGVGIHSFNFTSVGMTNSLIANGPINCNGPLVQDSIDGHNVESGDTCGLNMPTDIVNAHILLAPLADNGGPTQTHAFLPHSDGIDVTPIGENACGLLFLVDQCGHGFPRPVNGKCDAGSFELGTSFVPVALAESYVGEEDMLLTVSAPGVLANDIDGDGDSLTAVLDNTAHHGSLTLSSNGSFLYLPTPNFCGTDSFAYHANDGQTNSNSVVVMLTIDCVNDAPIATAGTDVTAVEGQPILFNGHFYDADQLNDDGTVLTHTIHWDFGDTASANSILTPTHAYGDNNTYTVTLTVTDSMGGVGTDWLVIHTSNANPQIAAIGDITTSVNTVIGVHSTYTDAGHLDTHSATIDWGDGTMGVGTATDGTFNAYHTYTTEGFYTVVAILSDDDGGSDTQTFMVEVTAVTPTYIFLPIASHH